jgi:site-specific DNA recombinase
MAALERLKISERTVRGRIDRVKNGKLIPGGKPLYGYQWKDETKGQLVPDPETAPMVQRIYGELAKGKALNKIAVDLTRDRVPTPTGRGTVWHSSTLSAILHKPAYKGEAFGWGLRKAGAQPQHFDPEKAIRLPDGTIPALIDEVTWEASKRILKRNQERSIRSAKNPETALLRGGFVRCGYCGRAAKTRPRSDGRGSDYYCNPSRGFGCKGPSIMASILDAAVWDRTRAILTEPNLIAQEVERLRREDPTGEDLKITDTQLADIERQRANISRAVAMIDDPDALSPLVSQLKNLAERDKALRAMKAEIEQRRGMWDAARTNLDRLNEWCATVAANIDELTWEQKRLALDALCISVTLFRADHDPRFVITATVDQQSTFSTT